MRSHIAQLAKLLTRKAGITSREAAFRVGTLSLHRRLSDMERLGWRIDRQKVPGSLIKVYRGVPPKKVA